MVVVVPVKLGVELRNCQSPWQVGRPQKTYQIQHRHFHHALVEVGGSVLDNLDSNHFLRLQVLAFDDLAESTLAEDVEDEVPVPVISTLAGNSNNLKHKTHTCARPLRTLIYRSHRGCNRCPRCHIHRSSPLCSVWSRHDVDSGTTRT